MLIDTDVFIHWTEGHETVRARLAESGSLPLISAITRAELEGGVYRDPEFASERRALLDAYLAELDVLPFTSETARQYGDIIAVTGFARRRVNDRMIAATAIVHELPFATINASDFLDVPSLRLEDWSVAR